LQNTTATGVAAQWASVEPSAAAQWVLTFPEGMPGFERHHRYALLQDARLAPFFWLQSMHDPLTGLGNRSLFQQRFEQAVSRRPRPRGLALLLVDLDGFKAVNDSRGHAVGDLVLRLMAERLRSVTRDGDTLARVGGDEFVLLCPDATPGAAAEIAERVLAVVGRPLRAGDDWFQLGASVGVSHASLTGVYTVVDAAGLLREADRAMYEAKKAGKGRVVVAPAGA